MRDFSYDWITLNSSFGVASSAVPFSERKADGHMDLEYYGWKGRLHGGPFRNKPDHMFGIKMASEVALDAHVDVPCDDFQVPPIAEFVAALRTGVVALISGEEVYVGCLGGIGRTGLYFAAMAKLFGYKNPIGYVRWQYKSNAVETKAQQDFIHSLDLTQLQRELARTMTQVTKVPAYLLG
jgi:hypothetical protein